MRCYSFANSIVKRSLKAAPSYAKHAAVLYLVTFAFALPWGCRHLHNSVYFVRGDNSMKAVQERLRIVNSERLLHAEAILSALNGRPSVVAAKMEPVDVAISVITVSRNRHRVDDYEPMYLSQVIAELLVLQGSQDLLNVELSVCDVDVDPGAYDEVSAPKTLVPVHHKYDHDRLRTKLHSLEKEKRDYLFCLQHALNTSNASYVFLVEDDALPSPDLFKVLHHTIMLHLQRSYHHNEFHAPDTNTAFVKFYHPPHLLGYIALEPERLSELLAISCVFGSLVTALYWRASSATPASSDLYISWSLAIVCFALLALTIGRANIQELRHCFSPYFYSYTPAPSCCTPAVLYPGQAARAVATFLNSTKCHRNFGKDSALDLFQQRTNWRSFLVQPNTFTHIGQYSSRCKKLVDPFVVN